MKACASCGSSRRLRFDHDAGQWVCVPRCGVAPRARSRPRKREAMFSGWWSNPAGERWRATRGELREAHRLWYTHRDIREGRVAL
jgi:hypothetical protein